jgi:hypothetical protein
LLSAPNEKPVGLHSFNVDEELRQDLERKGLAFFGRSKAIGFEGWYWINLRPIDTGTVTIGRQHWERRNNY